MQWHEIYTSQGYVGALICLRPCCKGLVWPLDGSLAFDAHFEARHYYSSRSGRSHAAAVPPRPGVYPVRTYRTDVRYVQIDVAYPLAVMGMPVTVPVRWDTRTVDDGWPVVIADPRGRMVLTPVHMAGQAIRAVLAGEVQASEFTQANPRVSWSYRLPGPDGPRKEVVEIPYTTYGGSCRRERSALAALVRAEADAGTRRAEAAGEVTWEQSPLHWVGMRTLGGYAYRVRGGVATAAVPVADLADPARLQEMLPAACTALAADVVLVDFGSPELRGPDWAVELAPPEYLDVLMGGLEAARPIADRAAASAASRRAGAVSAAESADEPLAEWERDLLAGQV